MNEGREGGRIEGVMIGDDRNGVRECRDALFFSCWLNDGADDNGVTTNAADG